MEAIILDAAIVVVLLGSVFLGWKRGLFRSLGELVVLFLALVLAYEASVYAAPQIIDRTLRPATHKAIEEQVDAMLQEQTVDTTQRQELEQILDAIPSDFIREKAKALIDSLELSLEEKFSHSARDPLIEAGKKVADTVLDTAVYSLVQAVLYLVAFLIAETILKLILRALDLTMRLPVLRQLNSAGGVLFGAVKGAVIVWFTVWILVKLGLIIDTQVVEESHILCHVIQWAKIGGIPAP